MLILKIHSKTALFGKQKLLKKARKRPQNGRPKFQKRENMPFTFLTIPCLKAPKMRITVFFTKGEKQNSKSTRKWAAARGFTSELSVLKKGKAEKSF